MLALIIGFVLGYIITLTGVGGGVLVIPTISLLFGFSPSVSVGTASFYTTLTKVLAMLRHAKIKTIDYQTSLAFLIPSSLGVVVSSILINYYLDLYRGTEREALIQNILYYIILAVIAFSIIVMLRETFLSKDETLTAKNKSNKSKFLFYFIALLTGLIIGTTGVGGGVLIIPVLLFFFKLNPKQTVGSSILIALVLSFLTSIVYTKGGNINFQIAALMTLGSFLGIYLGGKTVKRISSKNLKIAVLSTISFCCLLLILLFFK